MKWGYSGADAQKNFQNDNPQLGAVLTHGEDGKPDSLVIPDGTARGFHYDQSGNIDGINKTNPDGTTQQYRRDAQGQWIDENGNPGGFAKPSFDEKGNYSYYTPDAKDPTKLLQTSIDTKAGATSAAEVPADSVPADPPVTAGPTDNAAPSGDVAPFDIAPGAQGKMGQLDVVGAEGGGEYTINKGDTLTDITRRILDVQPGQADPANFEDVMKNLASANKIEDINLILAGAQMKVPADIRSGGRVTSTGSRTTVESGTAASATTTTAAGS